MKFLQATTLSIVAMLLLSYCSSSRNAAKSITPAPITYETNIQQLVTAHCGPCHIPASGGKKLALDSYDGVSKNIDDIVSRIEKNPGDRGFMPFKHEKLSDSTINVFKQWKTDGLLAK